MLLRTAQKAASSGHWADLDIQLIPLEPLPDSPNSVAFARALETVPSMLSPWHSLADPWAALVTPITVEPFLRTSSESALEPPEPERGEKFESVRHCLAIACGAPVLPGPSWFQYDDPDLQAAVLGS
jgi:hypothetical protein